MLTRGMGEPTNGLDFLLSLVVSFCETCSAQPVPKLLLLDTRGTDRNRTEQFRHIILGNGTGSNAQC